MSEKRRKDVLHPLGRDDFGGPLAGHRCCVLASIDRNHLLLSESETTWLLIPRSQNLGKPNAESMPSFGSAVS